MACASVIVVAVALVYWPGVDGFWGRDDFAQLAISRLLGTPWPLFVQDHYPVPGAVFRPLGFASMWFETALFGTDYRAHAIVDLALHAGVALALFGLLRRLAVTPAIALACTLLFALHPVTVGTALWWSARFDVLATLFLLLSLIAASAWRERGDMLTGVAALLAALAAMACKEIGLVAVLPLSLFGLHHARTQPGGRTRALRAVAWAGFCAIGYLAWRACVLGTASSALTGSVPMGQAIAKGMLDWVRLAPGYFSFWVRLDGASRGVLLGAAVVLVVAVARVWWREVPRRHALALSCGACLLLAPALLQAPIAALNAEPLSAHASAIEAAMQSRLYYLGLAGIAVMLAAGLSACASGRKGGAVLLLSPWLAVLAFAPVSHDAARSFAQRSQAISAVAREAVAAVDRLDVPPMGCRIEFLDVTFAPEWGIYVSMDSIVKALGADLGRVGHCVIRADQATWFGLFAAPMNEVDAAPYRPFDVDGAPLPWRRVGDLVIGYLQPPVAWKAEDLAGTIFLRWSEGAFEEVRVEVVGGKLVTVHPVPPCGTAGSGVRSCAARRRPAAA